MNELEKFFEGLPKPEEPIANFGDEAVKEAPEEGEKEKDEEVQETRKNRRHRRLEEALQRERESNIALNARIQALSEFTQKQSNPEPGEVPAEWIALYGDTPEARKSWEMEERLLARAREQAKLEIIEELEARQTKALEVQRQEEQFIDSQLEEIEEMYNLDLTSNAPAANKARREFLEMIQTLSPKNESGEIIEYADFPSTFEIYQKTRPAKKTSETVSRQKELASRSMQTPANSEEGKDSRITPGFRGWQKDYNLDY